MTSHRGDDPRYASLRELFVRQFGPDDADDNPHNDAPIHVLRSPGRVNLIGEHVDYNGGIVMPVAIGPHITFAFRRRTDGQVRLASSQYPEEEVAFEIDDDSPGEPAWSNYARGPVALLRRRGEVLSGMSVYLVNTLPQGAGLSSSAAMEVGTALAMLHVSGGEVSRREVAELCQRAEHEFNGVPCGIMDQTAVACAKAGHAMMLDCRSGDLEHVPLPADELAIVVTDSRASHALTDGGYRCRREQCERAAAKLGVSTLREATAEMLSTGGLDEVEHRRARHAVTEIARAQAFAEALRAGDYRRAGEQMYASHASLRDDYDVSTPELDFLSETARDIDGVYGSRMTGAGFGGCTVTLCRPASAEAVSARLAAAYRERFGIETLPFVTAGEGAAAVVD